MNNSQTPQEYFRLLLLTVVGQAFGAAGYELQERPVQWAGGQYRFVKSLPSGLNAFIEFQLLAYSETTFSSGMPSRFRVGLARTDQPAPGMPTTHPQAVQRDLSALVVEDFGVAILPSANHWWLFKDTDALGKGLAEAGHLVVGFGMPWLAGELHPPSA